MPAIKRETYEAFLREHFGQANDCTILTGESSIPLPYGRILRDGSGVFLHVVEDRDCTPEQLKIEELNTGVYLFSAPLLLDALGKLRNENAQGEYYLTDVPAIMRGDGAKVGLCRRNLGDEIIGVNTTEQLAQVEGILIRRGY
jgi:bifunctional N-acetylglucosamine-1-phosphate-uridyltransferase/glucosamine-1-phosphate-acetyltransferase GlmU-like protein